MRKSISTIIVFISTILLCLAGGELLLRMFIEPIDFLKPKIIDDEILSYRIAANSAHHDEWGFRNMRGVPEKADIVTIGDSQTYGDGAPARWSWPSQLAKLSGKAVYNLSLGGYGPAQYLYLLREKAIQLHPSTIIIGFYAGNDFLNTYEIVYGNEYWKKYRNKAEEFAPLSLSTVEIIRREDNTFVLGGARSWLSQHFMLYRMGTAAAEMMRRNIKKKEQIWSRIFFLKGAGRDIDTGFKAKTRLQQMDYSEVKIQEGYRITVEMLQEMQDICRAKGIELLILEIPSKESVYQEYLLENKHVPDSSLFKEIIEDEAQWKEKLAEFFTERGINYVDALDDMRKVLSKERIFHNNYNDHPNSAGYRILAESVLNRLK